MDNNNENRLTEYELILPALYVIYNNDMVDMSRLIAELTDIFKPSGEDAEILKGRNDTKFSQKVRNLKSHRESNGMDKYTTITNGIYTLTPEGKVYVEKNWEYLEWISKNNFNSSEIVELDKWNKSDKNKYFYDENLGISEGRKITKNIVVRERSNELRECAMNHYMSDDEHIKCCVCNFDFYDTYGILGKSYIEMHHEKPLFQYQDENFKVYIRDAILNIKPLCSNCHKIIHRRRNQTLTVQELKSVIDENS